MLSAFAVIVFIILGIIAGFLSGLLGIGGGAIVVPTLLVTFTKMGFKSDTAMYSAVGTSLAAMIFTAASSAWSHYKNNNVYWHYFRYMAPGIVFGAVVGAFVAEIIPAHYLKGVFGLLLLLTGIYFLFTANQKELSKQITPSAFLLTCVGFLIGFISTLLGIGGGIITVPLLIILGAPMKNAIATSALSGFFIALFGSLSFVIIGLVESNGEETFGNVYVPAFLIVGVLACLAAPVGARYSHSGAVKDLKIVFGIVQILIGALLFIFE